MSPSANPGELLDRAGPVREGEGLDREALGRWRAEALPELAPAGGGAVAVEVGQFGSGYSNLTYLLRLVDPVGAGRELVLRRPPVGSTVATAHDMGREHRILAALAPVFELAPRPLAACADPAVLGAPVYVMARVRGVILRRDPPAGLDLGPESARRLSEAFADRLAELHAVDVEAAGLSEMGRPGYVGRQVAGWSERWRGSRTDPVPEMDAVAGWLAADQPPEPARLALVHNDYKLDNLVLDPADPARFLALLDWEMATVGAPLLDLGTALGYWVEAGDPEAIARFRFGPTHLPGMLTRRGVAERYLEAAAARGIATGGGAGGPRDPGEADLAFAYAFGLFKIAVIAQQIYARWRAGLTRDPRFAALLPAIRALAARAAEVAGGGRI
jgi:aminoglycoside phosphotransferase (APT) family kinase protein